MKKTEDTPLKRLIKSETPEKDAFIKILETILSCENFEHINNTKKMLTTYDQRFPDNVGHSMLETALMTRWLQIEGKQKE